MLCGKWDVNFNAKLNGQKVVLYAEMGEGGVRSCNPPPEPRNRTPPPLQEKKRRTPPPPWPPQGGGVAP